MIETMKTKGAGRPTFKAFRLPCLAAVNGKAVKFCADLFPAHKCPSIKFKKKPTRTGNLRFLFLAKLLYGICVKIFIMNRYISKSYTTTKNTIM